MNLSNFKYKVLFLLLINIGLLYAQDGNPYITNFNTHENTSNKINCIENSINNIMFYGTEKGVLVFNSQQWHLIETPSAVLSLMHINENSDLIVGLKKGAGIIHRTTNGGYYFKPLSDSFEMNPEIFSIKKHINNYLLVSANKIFWVNIDGLNNSITKETITPFQIEDVFSLNNMLYVISKEGQILMLESNVLATADTSLALKSSRVIFSCSVDNEAIIGLENGTLYSFKNNKLQQIEYEDHTYIEEGRLNGGLIFNDQKTVALSTISGGILVFNLATGKTINIINYQTGLPDDEVYALGTDSQNGLWASHLYGISRVDLFFPVKSFHNYTGIEGNIFCLQKTDTALFVGTNKGLFYLSSINQYNSEEKIKYINVKVPLKTKYSSNLNVTTKQTKPVSENTEKLDPEIQKERKKGFSKFLKKIFTDESSDNKIETANKKRNDINSSAIKKDDESENEPIDYTYKRKRVKKRIYTLVSTTYQYRKINGFDDKITEIVPFGKSLILLSNQGVFIFDGDNITPLIKNTYAYEIVISSDKNECFISTSMGLYRLSSDKERPNVELIFNETDASSSLFYSLNNKVLLTNEGLLTQLIFHDTISEINAIDLHLQGKTIPFMDKNENLLIYNNGLFYKFDETGLKLQTYFEDNNSSNIRIIKNHQPSLYVSNNKQWKALGSHNLPYLDFLKFLNVFKNITQIYADADSNIWVIENFNGVYKLHINDLLNYNYNTQLSIKHNYPARSSKFSSTNYIELPYSESDFEIELSSPFYIKENSVEYQYSISGIYNDESEWNMSTIIKIPYLPPGKYALEMKARNIFGYESKVRTINIKVLPPFWQTLWFYILIIVSIIVLLFLYMKYRERKIQKEKSILEDKVNERTREIEKQKSRIEDQALAITDSILYAQRIQVAMLPSLDILKNNLEEFFVFFKPRDIVSGDFYWAFENDDKLYLAAVDCTGHGVPGAFMSMLGMSFLNELIKKQSLCDPAEILFKTRIMVMESLNTDCESSDTTSDGMDVALCVIHKKKNMIHYAGAYNPLFVVKKESDPYLSKLNFNPKKSVSDGKGNILIPIDASRMPVGNSPLNDEYFITHKVPYKKGDTFYIFSDGFSDQFGEEERRKYLIKNFKRKLLSLNNIPLNKQKKELETELRSWKGKENQLDDILVIGFKP